MSLQVRTTPEADTQIDAIAPAADGVRVLAVWHAPQGVGPTLRAWSQAKSQDSLTIEALGPGHSDETSPSGCVARCGVKRVSRRGVSSQ